MELPTLTLSKTFSLNSSKFTQIMKIKPKNLPFEECIGSKDTTRSKYMTPEELCQFFNIHEAIYLDIRNLPLKERRELIPKALLVE